MKIALTELGRHEALLRISTILKAGDKEIQLERKLASELIKNWRETYDDTLRGIFRRIPAEVSQSAIEVITKGLADALGHSFGSSQKVHDELRKYITRAYQGGKSEFAVKPLLTLSDLRAIDILTRHNCYWLGEHYGKHIGSKIAELTQEALADGLGREELAEQLREALGGKVGGYKYWDVASSAALVRSRSFGCVAGMVEAGIVEYEILAMADERMCPICGEMNGRTFSVSATQKVIDSVLDIKSPDDFKDAMSWHSSPPVGVSNEKLLADGMSIPPFHGRCRCTLVMAETEGSISGALGALNDANDPNESKRNSHAKRYYEELRRSKSEYIVKRLSEHSGVSLKSARKVYEHVFVNEYELDDGERKRFDPSYDMAESFRRLLLGEDIQEHDVILVHHERLEYELMNRYGKDSRTAHRLTCRKYDYQSALERWKQKRVN